MKNIAIIGAGGFGREILELILAVNKAENKFKIIGFYDDNIKVGEFINGYPVFQGNIDINLVDYKLNVALGIGDPKIKEQIVSSIDNSDISFPILIHPNALIGENNILIGIGTVICAGCIITCDISINKFVTLNLSCTVGHDTIIESYSSFMPGVNISGEVFIKKGVYVGTGAKIINQLTVGNDSIIGAGAVVSKSLPANCTAVGIPAKPIKFH